jgi:hypothetical protein
MIHQRRHSVRARLVLALVVLLGLGLPPTLELAVATPAHADTPSDMLSLVNAFRQQNGVGPLRLCRNLTNSIQAYTGDLAARGTVSHVGSNGSTFITRDEGAGYIGWTALGENLAAGQGSVPSVMSAWEASPDHRANILDPSYTDIGVGLTTTAGGVSYWGQEFGANGTCGNGPVGSLDRATSSFPGTINVTGWTLERTDPTTSLSVDVYVDGRGVGRFTANGPRSDIATTFSGAGTNHGYTIQVGAAGGMHTVCVYAISAVGDSNTQLGCATVGVANASPIGTFDLATNPSPGRVRVAGWTFDPESTSPISVDVYADGQPLGRYTANGARFDVAAAYPGYGAAHGYDLTLPINAGGNHTVCVYGINVYNGGNTTLGCRGVYVVPADPFGSLDQVAAAGPGKIQVSGWSIDPDSLGPIVVAVYVDSSGTPVLANLARPDLAAAYPAFGPNHGFGATISTSRGTHTVCVYGLNVAVGVNHLLGCGSVTV